MSHTITIRIRDEIYSLLTEQAADAGVTPDVLAELKIAEGVSAKPKNVSKRQQRAARMKFVGAVDSRQSRNPANGSKVLSKKGRVKDIFGDGVEEKMKRIGLKIQK